MRKTCQGLVSPFFHPDSARAARDLLRQTNHCKSDGTIAFARAVNLLWLVAIGASRLPRLIIRRKALSCFFVTLLFAMWAITRLEVIAGPQIRIVVARPEGGDEPHYLLSLLSIMYYHRLEMDYAYVRNPGGYYLPDRHTILVNRRTGQHASPFDRIPAFSVKSHDIYEVPAHPIGYPALLAAFLAPLSPDMRYLVRDASVVMVVISWSVVSIVYLIVRNIGMGCGPALLAASALGLASPWLAYSRSFYPEPAIGLAMVLALWAMASRRPKLAALAAGAAANEAALRADRNGLCDRADVGAAMARSSVDGGCAWRLRNRASDVQLLAGADRGHLWKSRVGTSP
jgi:hypothetical protein